MHLPCDIIPLQNLSAIFAKKMVWYNIGTWEVSIKKLQVNMANIRKKLGIKPGDTRYIINELGVGYRMQDPQRDADNP